MVVVQVIVKGTSPFTRCFSYVFSPCPAGLRSPTRPGRWRSQTHRRACRSPGSPGRSWSRRCSGCPDEENTNTERGWVGGENRTQEFCASSNVCVSHVPSQKGQRRLCGNHHGTTCTKGMLLTYWKSFSPFLLQPMRYRATSGAPCSQVALKLV